MSNRTSPEEIKKIHEEILEKMNPEPSALNKWLNELLTQIKNFIFKIIMKIVDAPPIMKIILIVIGLLLLAFLIRFIIIRLKGRYTYKKQNSIENPMVKKVNLHSQKSFLKAIEEAQKGNFNKAILTLHRGSVRYLHEKKKLKYYRDYTNREIANQLDIKTKPFQTLAKEAENILFGENKVEESNFIAMKSLYKEHFYE